MFWITNANNRITYIKNKYLNIFFLNNLKIFTHLYYKHVLQNLNYKQYINKILKSFKI